MAAPDIKIRGIRSPVPASSPGHAPQRSVLCRPLVPWHQDCRAALAFLKRPDAAHDAIDGEGITLFIKPQDLDASFTGFHCFSDRL